SATISTSSSAVGWSCMMSAFATRCEKAQKIDFSFGRTPPNGGALHRAVAGFESHDHGGAHDAPFQRAQHFPIFHARRIDPAAACRFISGKHIFARTKAADRTIDIAKTP